jgi:hypothetical protein
MHKRKRPSRSGIVIELEINGETWHRVGSLADSGPDDRHFVGSTNESGATTLQFGDGEQGARLPAAADRVVAAYQSSNRFVAVVQEQGRVIVDRDWHESGPDANRVCGLYRGVVTNDVDPMSQSRVEVQVSAVLGNQSVWALPCRPVGGSAVPAVGASVWVAFERCDAARPVWMGIAG